MACGATLKRHLEFEPLYSPVMPSSKRRRFNPLGPSPPARCHQTVSPFEEIAPRLTREQMAAKVGAELRRLQRRRHFLLQNSSPPPNSPSPPLSCTSSPEITPSSSSTNATCTSTLLKDPTQQKRDVALFTFRQVSLVCEHLLREREEQIREKYNTVLNNKLAEQYESFLKFNYDQIHRRMDEKAASYVS